MDSVNFLTFCHMYQIYLHILMIRQLEPANRKEYRSFVQKMLQKNKTMHGEMDRRTVYGGSEFIQSVNRRYNLEAVIRQRGLPEKENPNK